MNTIALGLQMYTVRDNATKDFKGTLERVSRIGYRGVEWAGYGGLKAAELKTLIDALGVASYGAHVGLDALTADLPREIDFHLILGSPTITVPWLPERFRTEDGIREVADVLNGAGALCKQSGLQLCYHNHDFEFQKIGDRHLLDLLYANTDAALVKAEIDTYWVEYAGLSAARVIRDLSGRCPLVHLKDMARGTRKFAEFGEGTMDWDDILAACEAAGTQYYVIEQDVCERPPMDAIRISFENAVRQGLA